MNSRMMIAGMLVAAMLAGTSCRRGVDQEQIVAEAMPDSGVPLYTACNMWYEHPLRMSSINYQTGALIPAGSEVRNVRVATGRRPAITFTVATTGMEHRLEFTPKYHPGKSVMDVRNRLFTERDLAALTADFSADEKESVRLATVRLGISKKAVLVVCGYPPEHQTPMLETASWTYWKNRAFRRVVTFDADGKVSNIKQ